MSPEGFSILVVSPSRVPKRLADLARIQARRESPDVKLTGKTLWVGINELGEDRHEVVLEVAA